MNQLIANHATGKNVLLIAILSGIIYALMAIVTIPMVLGNTDDLVLLDAMSKGYNCEYVMY